MMSKPHSIYCLLCILIIYVCKSGASTLNFMEVSKFRSYQRTVVYNADFGPLFDKMAVEIQDALLSMGLDSKQVDDVSFYLSDIVGFPLGKIKLSRGVLSDLYKIKRVGSLTATYSKKVLALDLNLGWDLWNASFLYAHELIFTREGFLDMVILEPKLNFLVEVDFVKHEAEMKKISFTDIGKMSTSVRGNVADFVTNMAIDVITLACKDQMLAVIENTMLEVVNNEMEGIFPPFKLKHYLL